MNDLLTPEAEAADRLGATAVLPPFDDSAALARATPARRSELIDRAYEEYHELLGHGVTVDPDAFCARFPALQTALRRLLEVHRDLEDDPEIIGKIEQIGQRWPHVGEEFFGFQLLQELGRGAFARVFLAREHAVGGRLVVVKVSLHADNEAHTLGRLQHPNVVPVYSAQYDPAAGFAVVCMPFLGGTTLCDVIDHLAVQPARPERADVLLEVARDDRWPADGAPAPARAVRRGRYLDGVLYLAERLADALAYVHEQGFLHRDLKPSNVLLCPNGEPVLLDFNLALDRALAEHRLGGTLPYMPPELLQAMAHHRPGDPVPTEASADLFALGVMLYELLAGVHPFGPVPLKLPAAQVRPFLIERQRSGPRPLRELNPAVDAGLADLIHRCLAWNPAERPTSARELAAALRRCQSIPRRAIRWMAAHVRMVALASALLVAGAAAGAYEVATLPTPAARAAQEGGDLLRDGRYEDAVRALTRSLELNPDQPAVYFQRGRAYQLLANWDEAIEDFRRAEPEKDGRVAACLGFCLNFKGKNREAIKWHERATQAGHASAAVYNNLAYSRLMCCKLPEAEMAAAQALNLNADLLAAHYNRAVAVHKRGVESAIPDVGTGLIDIRLAISGLPATAKLFRVAAELCALELHNRGNPTGDPLFAEGEEYFRRAVMNGQPSNTLAITHLMQNRECVVQWAERLPSGLKTTNRSPAGQLNLDMQSRLVDPLSGADQ